MSNKLNASFFARKIARSLWSGENAATLPLVVVSDSKTGVRSSTRRPQKIDVWRSVATRTSLPSREKDSTWREPFGISTLRVSDPLVTSMKRTTSDWDPYPRRVVKATVSPSGEKTGGATTFEARSRSDPRRATAPVGNGSPWRSVSPGFSPALAPNTDGRKMMTAARRRFVGLRLLIASLLSPKFELGDAFEGRPACIVVIHGVLRVFRHPPGTRGARKCLAGPSGSARFADAIVALSRRFASSMAFFGLLGLDESRAFGLAISWPNSNQVLRFVNARAHRRVDLFSGAECERGDLSSL